MEGNLDQLINLKILKKEAAPLIQTDKAEVIPIQAIRS